MSPEIVRNKLGDVDPRTIDVWALLIGVNFCSLYGGFHYEGIEGDTKEIFYKIDNGIYSYTSYVPIAAVVLVSKMLMGDRRATRNNWLNIL